MFNKSKKTAFSTVNVDELLINEGAEVNHEEPAEPAPVVEKVTLKEIKEEQSTEESEEVFDALNKFLDLTPEQREKIMKALFG